MNKLKKEKLLILDERLLYPLKEVETRDVMELIEARHKVSPPSSAVKLHFFEWRTHARKGSGTKIYFAHLYSVWEPIYQRENQPYPAKIPTKEAFHSRLLR